MSTPVTYRERLMDRYALLLDWLPEQGPVLDVGCGNGIFTSWLARKAGSAVGIDHNQANLAWGRQQFPNVSFVSSNGETLPFADQSFAAVMCTEVLEHTRDDRSTLREIHRVTKSGGYLLLSTPHQGLFAWLDPDNVLNASFDLVRRCRIPKPGGKRLLANFRYDWHRHYTESHLRSLMGTDWQVEQVFLGGLLLYPVLYGAENMIDAFSRKRSYWMDLRLLRTLRSWDFFLPAGRLAYNIALKCRKTS